MTETGILNRDIAAIMARMGHTDILIIADAGLAIPDNINVVDLSIDINVPTTVEILKVILKNFSVEKLILSDHTKRTSPSRKKEILSCFPQIGPLMVPLEEVTEETMQYEIVPRAKLIIRSGDFTADSNIILVSGGGNRWYCERVL